MGVVLWVDRAGNMGRYGGWVGYGVEGDGEVYDTHWTLLGGENNKQLVCDEVADIGDGIRIGL